MNFGDFVFDLPVWIAGVRGGDKQGICCGEVEGQVCLLIFTDEDLIQRHFDRHPSPYEIIPAGFESADVLATALEECCDIVAYVAFDPGIKAYMCPIGEVIEVLRGA
jgi:hypothetical protein